MFQKKVVYYFDEDFGTYHYSTAHPMKPIRVEMTDELIRKYELDKHMDRIDLNFVQEHIVRVNEDILTKFHSKEYIDLVRIITPENKCQHEDQLYRFNFCDDCPVIDRLYDYCVNYTSGSVAGACLLADKKCEIAINWSGGLHHAKQSEASGFCYVNDCVLAILELLKILYVDIDIHHGDGVEEAFYLTDRVMTCSFHKFKEYFPGTGHLDDIGYEEGQYYSVNFPLNEGLDDDSFSYIHKIVLQNIMAKFNPEAIVLQGGSDSLSGDRLGCFNLSVKGHGTCIEFLKQYNVPIMMLGGGGYTLRNVPRCWAYETSLALGIPVPDQIPDSSQYYMYFGPEYKLHLPISNMEEQNTKEYLDSIIQKVMENLTHVNRSSAQIDNYQSGKFLKDSQSKIDYSELQSSYKDKFLDRMIDENQDGE